MDVTYFTRSSSQFVLMFRWPYRSRFPPTRRLDNMPEANLRAMRSATRTASRVHRSLELGEPASELMDTRPALSAWCFVALSILCVAAMVWASMLGARGCHVEPIAPGRASDVSIKLPANTPCTILVRTGNAVLDDIVVHAPPKHGTLTSRGRTGVVYRPAPGFKGSDSFIFSLQRRPNSVPETTVVHVRAVID
jgi:hypothetical protein